MTRRIAPRAVSVTCPYDACGETFDVDCEDLHSYFDTVECWHCGATFVVAFTIEVAAKPLKVEGEQLAMHRRLAAHEGNGADKRKGGASPCR